MLREEFNALCERKVSDEDYCKIEFVYNYHPCNFDKEGIAGLVEDFGMCIIYDLLPRSQAALEQELKIKRLKEDLRMAKERLEAAEAEDMRSQEFISLEGITV